MHGPVSAAWLLVALCTATGTYCLLRMRSGVEEQRRSAGGEALMGFGMAVMAVPAAVFAPPRWAWPVYAAVFGAAALRALWAARAAPHHLHHLVGASAMVYMAAAMAVTPPGPHHAHDGTGVPVLTGVLLVYFAGYVLLAGARLVPATVATTGSGSGTVTGAGAVTEVRGTARAGAGIRAGAAGWGDRPELARACRLSMGIGMVAMLMTM
ncbi:DUF5134 domain-containing protein [Streptomyces sp. IMTB 2501]|uniref:DUF5134 domain-containing protein n=1 Tax=Streptomyces sp. IMTB 2501 TaxID=1776340 RepID=UPI00096E0617|nr:DUF5134 domain-containing protein [Streptomyces sp. IMTB 2501]OLZ71981.1 DUF5134 domain-containing protein [Streptomyces sp. IMTB 2501]